MARTSLSHTADTGVEATADSLEGLVEELAMGMFELMAVVRPCPAGHTVETNVEAASVEDLVVDTLSELLYLAETEDLVLCRVRVTGTGERSLRVEASGVPARSVDLAGPPIKAVTYHGLEVVEGPDGWRGRVYFDV